MSYYHQNSDYDVYTYEYDDNGNYGNEYEYDSYSDHHEPDQYEPDHIESTYNDPDHNPSEPDYHSNEAGIPWDEGPEYETGGEIYEEIEGGHEHGELVHNDNGIREDWEGDYRNGGEVYEHGEVEDEDGEQEVHEHRLAYGDDETRELEELERMVNEEEYEPQGLDPRYDETQESHERTYELEHELGYGDDGIPEHEGLVYHNARTADRACAPQQLVYHEESGEYVHPDFLPPTPSPRTPTPRGRDSLCANQRGHVTTSNYAEAAPEPTHANHNTHEPTRTDHSNTLPHSPVTLPEASCLTPAPKCLTR